MDMYSHTLPLVLRAFTGASAALMVMTGLANVFNPLFYTAWAVGAAALLLGCAAFLCEFSPLGLHTLMKALPFLGEYRGRGIFYAASGFLTLGPEMKAVGQVAGVTMMISGAASVVLFYLGPSPPQSVGYEDQSALAASRLEEADFNEF